MANITEYLENILSKKDMSIEQAQTHIDNILDQYNDGEVSKAELEADLQFLS